MVQIIPIIASDYSKKVVPLVDKARSNIEILMYEWKWYGHESAGGVQKLNLSLVAAARRGVKIKALLNAESMGHAITKINGRTLSFLHRYNIEAKMGQFGGVVHAKMMIIDDNWLVLGSHNYSKCAFSRNQEVSIAVRGREDIKRFRDYFRNLWSQYC